MLICPMCRVSFPPGLDDCPNDGERLIEVSASDLHPSVSSAAAPIGTESLYPRTGGASEDFRQQEPGPSSSVDDHTRAERPSARGRGHASSGASSRTSSSLPRRGRTERHRTQRTAEERVGELLGAYKLQALLGRGGMGCVYRAEHVKLGRQVALKLLRDDHAHRRDAVARFFREARSVNRMRHRNIVDVTDFVELESGSAYLVMELLEGVSLGRLVRGGTLNTTRALALLIQICDGLAAAHAVGIVHRDLKPDNIFVVPTGDGADLIKLLDFGVAKLLWREEGEEFGFETAAGAVLGTPTYMSPEQAGGLAVDARADIYSLGAIMYELFTGQPVFRGKSFGEFVRKHLNETPVAPRDTPGGAGIDDRLEALIVRCLAKKPADRFASIDEVRTELMTLLGAVETRPPLGVAANPSAISAIAEAQSSLGEPISLGDALSTSSARSVGALSEDFSSSSVPSRRLDAAPLPMSMSRDSSTPHVDTAMSVGNLTATTTGTTRRGRALWLGLGALAVMGAGAIAIYAVTRDDSPAPVQSVNAATTPEVTKMRATNPRATPEHTGRGQPTSNTGPVAASFTVRVISTPAAFVHRASSAAPVCTTPCDVTIDPSSQAGSGYNELRLVKPGYETARIRIDLTAPPRTVSRSLGRAKKRRPRNTAVRRRKAKPDSAGHDPPTKTAPAPTKPRVTKTDKTGISDVTDVTKAGKRPTGPIDPSETLNPFGDK